MKSRVLEILNPENIKIDDREVEDLIMFTLKLSKKINFYNLKNKKEGNWDSLIELDDTFLIAEILKFDLMFYDQQRLNIVRELNDFSSQREKEIIFSNLFSLLARYFQNINKWYISSTRNITSVESSPIELELEQAITNKLKSVFTTFVGYYLGLKDTTDFVLNLQFDPTVFASIWEVKKIEPIDIFANTDIQQPPLSSGLKKLILLYNPVYSILYNIRLRARPLFERSLTERSVHKAHIGLVLAFFDLFKNLQLDLNSLSKKHLDYYYRNILMQKPKKVTPKKMFVYFDINQKQNIINLGGNSQIIAGQYDNGDNIIYTSNNEINLNNTKISELSTFFISKNNRFDYNSSFRLVSGLFSKTHCKSSDEVQKFNQNEYVFSTLGEEQFLKTDSSQTMDIANVGFAISSATLRLARSLRNITFKIQFTPNSIKTLTNLIIDISNHRGLSEEEIFSEIFDKMFLINYTNLEGWESIENYTLIYPEDWSEGEIKVEVELDKRKPSVDNYDEAVHQKNYNVNFPMFEFLLNPGDFYHSYSFLAGMELSKIEIDVSVNGLNKLTAQNKQGEVDINNEFDILGASPTKGSSIIIGSNELFCKPISKLNLRWQYMNLPAESEDLEDYFKNYNRDIDNLSFKLKLSALSDFTYKRVGSKDHEFEMFQLDKQAKIKNLFELNDLDVSNLQLKPKYDLDYESIKEYSKESETGFLKLTLSEPKIGFGFDVFTSIYNEAVLKATTQKKGEETIPPNQPWSPMIDNLTLDYKANTTLYFNQAMLSENDFEQQNSFFLVSNEGNTKTFTENSVTSSFLIPKFNNAGEFIIGLENINAPQILNLLVEVKKSENTDYEFSEKLEWYYSSSNGWKLLKSNQILYDETLSLLKSGVVSINLPPDISNDYDFFNNDKYYIKAVSKNKADQFSLIKAIHNNGLTLTEVVPEGLSLHSTPQCEAESVQELSSPVNGIIRINQPLPSFGGNQKETTLEFYERISYLLRHKNRPITKWDIEKFLLEKFDWLMHVKCIWNNPNDTDDERSLKILCLKKIDNSQNIDEIKLNGADMIEVKQLLYQYCSPFLKVEIINPVFEDLWIKCKIKFSNISGGKAINLLNNEFFKFICPWVTGEGQIKTVFKKSEIVQFIKSRPYVSFVTGLSIIHFKSLPDGGIAAYDSASSMDEKDIIESGLPWSVFVPRNHNKISIIDIPEYSLPEPMEYNELNIEGNFIINSGNSAVDLDFEPEQDENDTSASKNLSVIKIKI